MSYGFSDGDLLHEMISFLAVLAISIALMHWVRRRGTPDAALIAAVARFTRGRRAFAESDVVSDYAIIDLARIAVGCIASIRYGEIVISGWTVGNWQTVALAGTASLIALCVSIGLSAPLAIFVLMSTANILIDNLLGASTLGSMVMSIALLLLLLAPAGRNLSVDQWLVRHQSVPARFIAWQWSVMGAPHPDRLLIAKAASLFAYFCVCLYSVVWHLGDEAWLSGMVIAWVMLSQAANPHYHEQAWSLYQLSPWLFVNLSRVAIYGMFAWYLLVWPGLFFGRIVRGWVIGWGLTFFLISTFVLPLRFLGWYELSFWFALFFPAPWLVGREPLRLAVLFDDRCNLCDRTVRTLGFLDVFGQIEFRPIRRNLAFAEAHGVTLQQGLSDLVGVSLGQGQRYDGYDLYLTLARRMPLLWPILILLELGRIGGIGRRVYRFVADRRIRIFGVCTVSTIPDCFVATRQPSPPGAPVQVWPLMVSSIILALLTLSAAFLIRLPFTGNDDHSGTLANHSKSLVGTAALGFGIGRINVFNANDLQVFKTIRSVYFVDRNSSVINTEIDKRIHFMWNDSSTYKYVSYNRAMSRINVGCDKKYLSLIGEIHKETADIGVEEAENTLLYIVYSVVPWPKADDFLHYRYTGGKFHVLCRAAFDLSSGDLVSLDFEQEGVNEALRRAQLPALFRAEGLPVALAYPCRADAAWLNTVIESQQPFASDRKLVAAALALVADRYGEFELACAARADSVLAMEPRLSIPDFLRGYGPTCNAGVHLLEELVSAASASLELQGRIELDRAAAKGARDAGDHDACVRAAASGRAKYWSAIVLSNRTP